MLLSRVAERGDDALDGREEAHVQHAIDFVEDEHVHILEIHSLAAKEVFEAAGGRDDEARSARDLLDLGVFGEAAADQHGVRLERRADLVEGVEHLHGELAGGEKNQGEDGSLFAPGRGLGDLFEALDHGDQEAEGLAGAGGGSGEDVVAFERGRDGSSLHGRWGDEAGGGKARLEGVRDLEVGEGDGLGVFDSCGDGLRDLKRLGVQNRIKSKGRQGFPLHWVKGRTNAETRVCGKRRGATWIPVSALLGCCREPLVALLK
jgi:hypothetical protein